MRRISQADAYPIGEKCAFKGSEFQVMRVVASAVRMAEARGHDWRAVFAYPEEWRDRQRYRAGETRAAIDSVVERLLPDYARCVLTLNYTKCSRRLISNKDAIASSLGRHLHRRLSWLCNKGSQEIQWVENSSLDKVYGHGVEFHHEAVPHRVIAFIVGFDWLHRPGSPATVEVANDPPPDLASGSSWAEIVNSVREGVALFLEQGGSSKFKHRGVRVWFNA
jgi:hypothetical protein